MDTNILCQVLQYDMRMPVGLAMNSRGKSRPQQTWRNQIENIVNRTTYKWRMMMGEVKVKWVEGRRILWKVVFGQLASTCPCTRAIDRSSRVGYRLILVLTSLANTRAGQSERRIPPTSIRTPDWPSGLGGQRRILFTQPRGTSEHERHLLISFRRLHFS